MKNKAGGRQGTMKKSVCMRRQGTMKKSVCMRRHRVGKRIVPKWLHESANAHRTYIMHSYIQADSRQASTQACMMSHAKTMLVSHAKTSSHTNTRHAGASLLSPCCFLSHECSMFLSTFHSFDVVLARFIWRRRMGGGPQFNDAHSTYKNPK